MEVQRIQNDNKSINFNARVNIIGHAGNISKETKKLWKRKARNIGTDNDLITLQIKTLMDENTHNCGKLYNHCACVQAIYGSAMIDEKKLYDSSYIGYCVFRKQNSQEHMKQLVLDFLDKLDCKK